MTRGAISESKFRSTTTGERLSVALPSQLEDASMSPTPRDPAPLRFFASPDPLSRASDQPLGSSLGGSGPTSNDAPDQPKTAQTPPMVAGTDLNAKEAALGGAGVEDGASIDHGSYGLRCRARNGRNRRLSGRGGG